MLIKALRHEELVARDLGDGGSRDADAKRAGGEGACPGFANFTVGSPKAPRHFLHSVHEGRFHLDNSLPCAYLVAPLLVVTAAGQRAFREVFDVDMAFTLATRASA